MTSCRRHCVFLLIAAFVVNTRAESKCASGSIDVWPPAGSIPPNVAFLIEGYGSDRALVGNVQSCELVVVSESDKLCLVSEERYVGEYGVDQVVLRPERPLTPGASYRILAGDHSPRAEQWAEGSRLGSGLGSATWVVDLPDDETPPQWIKQPRVTKTEVKMYGCGPAIGATVRMTGNDNGPVLVRTVVRSDASEPRSFLLQPYEGKIHIGHGMCSGGFKLIPGHRYQAILSLVDAAGNVSESAPTQVDFTIPNRKWWRRLTDY